MIYPQTYEQKIGFDQIRGRLTGLCLCSLGEGLVREMEFSANFDSIRRQVKQTMEMMRIVQGEDFPDQNFFDVRASLKRIRIQNTSFAHPHPEHELRRGGAVLPAALAAYYI